MFSTALKIALNQLIFNATTWNNIAENDTTTPATTLPIALHTAWPGRAGSQTTSEATYTNYARATPARTSGGFTVNGTTGVVTLASAVPFPESSSTGNDQYLPFFSIGDGAGAIIQMGCLVKSGSTARPFVAATTDTLTCPGHTAVDTNRVVFFQVGNAALPGGITEGTIYFARSVSGDTLQIAATSGGSAIDITTSGAGIMMILDGFQVGNSYTPTLNATSAILVD